MSNTRFFNWLSKKRKNKEKEARLAQLPERAAFMIRAALQNPETTELYLNRCNLNNQHIPIILSLLSETKITSLNLFKNNIGLKGVKALAKNTALIKLELEYNHIGNKGAKAFAKNKTLRSLDLSSNKIGSKGAIAVAKNTSITLLNLQDNKIGPRGAKALAKNTTITSLGLCSNKIGPKGFKALAKNTTITSLDVNLNNIGLKGVKAFLTNHALLHLRETYSLNLEKHLASNRKLRTEIRNTAQVFHQLIVQQNGKTHAIDRITMRDIIQQFLPKNASNATAIAVNHMVTDAIESYKKVKANTATANTTTSTTMRR